ncbi:TraX family protein [Bifidobacterium reuteri]|nr:TraX family protein [Bifidobacterium reuteri]
MIRFDSFQIKIIACILMVIDHMAIFFPPYISLPMQWLGRLSFPLFVFLIGWGCVYTHNIRNYVLRLYVASVVMCGIALVLNRSSNAFTDLLHVALLIAIISSSKKKRAIGIAGYVIWQVVSTLILQSLSPILGNVFIYIASTIFANWISLDGGYFYVILGIVLWKFHDSRVSLSLAFASSVLLLFASQFASHAASELMYTAPTNLIAVVDQVLFVLLRNDGGLWNPLFIQYQWMMIFSLPIMLLYNNRRGLPVKWLFYVFYPAHLAIITIAMRLLGVNYGA